MALAIKTLVVCFCTVTVKCAADFVSVETESSNGLSGQSSKLGCVVKAQQEVKLSKVYWKKNGNILMRVENGGVQTEDTRLQFADSNWMESKDVSLLVKDTKISDEGKYSCTVVTNRGIAQGDARLVVKGKYSQPVMTSKLEKNLVELTCVTSGGYPIGAIHWFDGFNTNWTRSAETEHIQMEDKSFTLRSTFTSKDPSHAPYTCVVYNSEWKEEGRVEKNLTGDSDTLGSTGPHTSERTKNIAAAVVVIGSLICGLLVALLFFRRRSQRANRRPSTQPMLNSGPDHQDDDETERELKPPPYEVA